MWEMHLYLKTYDKNVLTYLYSIKLRSWTQDYNNCIFVVKFNGACIMVADLITFEVLEFKSVLADNDVEEKIKRIWVLGLDLNL